MKRRDFLSMTVATTAMAAAAGARPKARQAKQPKVKIIFVGGSYFVPLQDRYLAMQPAGHDGMQHRAFIVGPRTMKFGSLSEIALPPWYPLQVMHPALGTAQHHAVFCLDRTDVVVGDTANRAPKMKAMKLAPYNSEVVPGTGPKGNWHDPDAEVPAVLCARFQLLDQNAEIDDSPEINTLGAGKDWKAKKHANRKKLSDATHFLTDSRKIMVKKYGERDAVQAVIPSGDVVLYVFGGPSESTGMEQKPSYSHLAHPEVLRTLYDSPNTTDDLKLYVDPETEVVKIPFVVNITHPCDVGGQRIFTHRMIPPDTEFCVNEEGAKP